MGAFYLVRNSDPAVLATLQGRARASLQAQGLRPVDDWTCDGVALGIHRKRTVDGAAVFRHSDGSFAHLVGTAIVDGQIGEAAARALLLDFDLDAPDWSRVVGSFCALVWRGGELTLFADPLGVYKVYTDRELGVFSSSFLATASCVESRTAHPQGVYEYVHQEATYGEDTVLEEVRLAKPAGRYVFGPKARFVPWPRPALPEAARAGSREEHEEACLSRLRAVFRAIASAFGDAVDTALSGGYDSRLTLALLREQGITPALHVYGRPDDGDVRIAREIAQGEGLGLKHVDKSRFPDVPPRAFAEVVERNFLAFDGYPPAGLFDSGADLRTRHDRAAGGRLMLNGGGGEIFRNFFYLRDRPFRAREIVSAFYSRYAPAWCTGRFSERAYVDALCSKLLWMVGRDVGALTRVEVEYLYPAFRCGYWMGRNNSINNRIGWALTPFIDNELVRCALAVPLTWKNHGRFEGGLIRAVSARLAGYPSDYGHDFAADPPLTRVLRDHLTLLRPPAVRRYTYRLRFRRPQPKPRYLESAYVGRALTRGFERMSNFYRVEQVNDPGAYARLCTLEYVFDRLGVDIAG